MLKIFLKKAFAVQTLAVFATVGICASVLLLVRPWRDEAMPETEIAVSTVEARQDAPVTQAVKVLPPADAPAPVTAQTAPAEAPAAAPPAAVLASVETKADPIANKLAEPAAPKPAPAPDPAYTGTTPAPAGGAPSKRMSRQEADDALRPLLSYSVSEGELSALKELSKLVGKDDYNGARTYLARIGDPAAKKLALWLYYRAGASDTQAEDIAAFRAGNPLWPARATLADRAEDALFWREEDPKRVLAFFHDKQPVSGAGWAALGCALIDLKRAEEGRPHLRRAWRGFALTPSIEARIKEKYAAELRPQDHKARIDFLLAQDSKSHLPAVERLAPLIDKRWETSVQARSAAVKRAKNAGALLAKLSPEAKAEPGVMLARIREARRADKDSDAWALLRSSPSAPEQLLDPAQWWPEREAEIRAALNAGDPKTAYAIARAHAAEPDPDDFSDAEFLAGWVALRFLNQPKTARDHFKAAAVASALPSRRARAAYWLGRTEMALGNPKAAAARFAEGAQHSHTFYGQLAHQMVEAKDAKHSLRTYVRPSPREVATFVKYDVMKAAVIASKAGLDGVVATFLFDLARTVDSAPDMILTAELASRIARPHIAVRMAKIAMNREFPMEYYAYPDALPDFKALTKDQDLEAALLYALTRQESEFNPQTVSSAGAVGLMQLLPSTAKEVARALAVKFEKGRLITDPAYNVSLGSAFLQQLMRSYDGSYVMTLAAYNAGPGRVRQWVALFGDPRDKNVDPIDWVERIPITETREYVQKIMESVQVYRSRLNQKRTSLQLAQDLYRGRADQPRFMQQAGAP